MSCNCVKKKNSYGTAVQKCKFKSAVNAIPSPLGIKMLNVVIYPKNQT